MQQCHVHTIAEYIGVDDNTINAHFSKLIAQKRAEGRKNLYRTQYVQAMNGENTMLIWLGKQHLDQSDKSKLETNSTVKIEGWEIIGQIKTDDKSAQDPG